MKFIKLSSNISKIIIYKNELVSDHNYSHFKLGDYYILYPNKYMEQSYNGGKEIPHFDLLDLCFFKYRDILYSTATDKVFEKDSIYNPFEYYNHVSLPFKLNRVVYSIRRILFKISVLCKVSSCASCNLNFCEILKFMLSKESLLIFPIFPDDLKSEIRYMESLNCINAILELLITIKIQFNPENFIEMANLITPDIFLEKLTIFEKVIDTMIANERSVR